jgi:hypothetical protein
MKKFTYVLIIASLLLGLLAVSPVGAKQGVLKLVELRDSREKNRIVLIFQVNKGLLHVHHPHAAFFIKRVQIPMWCDYKKTQGNIVVCEAPKRLIGRGGQEATLLINNQVFTIRIPRLRPITR